MIQGCPTEMITEGQMAFRTIKDILLKNQKTIDIFAAPKL